MLHKRLAPLTLLAFAAIAVPAQCSPSKGIDKKDCIVGLDGFCVDSIDFNPPPNDNLLAFATLPANPMDESSIFSDPFATDLETGLGTEDPGESGSLFSDYNDLDGFQLAASSRLGCTCPGDIPSTKGCVYADSSGDPAPCTTQCCRRCCHDDDATPLTTCRPVTDNSKCS